MPRHPHAAQVAAHSSGRGSEAGKASTSGHQEPTLFELPPQLRQLFIEVPCKGRLLALAALLQQQTQHGGPKGRGPGSGSGKQKVVVFMASCAEVRSG